MILLLGIYNAGLQWLEAHQLTCPSRSLFHMDCPGCGLQRSFIAMLKGDWTDSLHLYPALVPILILLTYAVLHFKFKFRQGARTVLIMQILVVSVVTVHYIYKILNHQIFY